MYAVYCYVTDRAFSCDVPRYWFIIVVFYVLSMAIKTLVNSLAGLSYILFVAIATFNNVYTAVILTSNTLFNLILNFSASTNKICLSGNIWTRYARFVARVAPPMNGGWCYRLEA